MKLTAASTYALHALAYLASRRGDGPVPSHHVAEAAGVPDRYVLKVLKMLVSARILGSVKGPNGGYWLARPAADISVLDVIEAVDAPVRGHNPLADARGAKGLDARLQAVCEEAAGLIREELGRVRLSDLTGGQGKARGRRGAAPRR